MKILATKKFRESISSSIFEYSNTLDLRDKSTWMRVQSNTFNLFNALTSVDWNLGLGNISYVF